MVVILFSKGIAVVSERIVNGQAVSTQVRKNEFDIYMLAGGSRKWRRKCGTVLKLD